MRKDDKGDIIQGPYPIRIVDDRKNTKPQNISTLGVPAEATRVGLFGLQIRARVINKPDNVRLDRNHEQSV